MTKTFIVSLATIISLPILFIFSTWLYPNFELWEYFFIELALELFTSTTILLIGSAIGVALLGSILAFIVTFVDIPYKRFWTIALFLPFTIPAYVMGFIYLGVFDYSGYGQVVMREVIGISGFDLRDTPLGIIAMFVLAFYPYVYMAAKASFNRQKTDIFASAILLNTSVVRVFFRVAFPIIKPAVIAGTLVASMEVLADFGLVSLFNYNTFTLAIYSAWSDFRSIEMASQLSSLLVLITFILLYSKQFFLSGKHHSYGITDKTMYYPSGYKKMLIMLLLMSIFSIAFVLPIVQLLIWGIPLVLSEITTNYLDLVSNTLVLSMIATLCIIIFALIFVFNSTGKLNTLAIRIATAGYVLPGAVIAVGILYGVSSLSVVTEWLGVGNLNFMLFGSIALLIFAYITRFITIAYNTILASKEQIHPVFIESATLLGASKYKQIRTVYLPMLKVGIITSSSIVMIDIIKELPATYLLRPFGYDTLAVKTYEFSTEGLYELASIPALFMVGVSIVLLLLVNKMGGKISH